MGISPRKGVGRNRWSTDLPIRKPCRSLPFLPSSTSGDGPLEQPNIEVGLVGFPSVHRGKLLQKKLSAVDCHLQDRLHVFARWRRFGSSRK